MAATALVGGGLTGFMLYVRKEKQEAVDRERKRQLGKAKIGGNFELVNSEVRILFNNLIMHIHKRARHMASLPARVYKDSETHWGL